MNRRHETTKNTIKTYCYGELKEFNTIAEAVDFYMCGVLASEGAERDRYISIIEKMRSGITPYCDCDGLPKAKEPQKELTIADIANAKKLVERRRNIYASLDVLREKLNQKQKEFDQQNASLLTDIRKLRDEGNKLSLALIDYEKRGFKV